VTSLRELQRAFGQALREDPGAASPVGWVVADGLPAERRVQVYRNNVLANLSGTLEAVYPVVQRLVGEDCFAQVAKGYVRRVPSRCGDLHAYGSSFPEFLEQVPQLAELDYLPDVARLEWAYHEVFHAADAPPLNLAAMADTPADRWHSLGWVLHPATALLSSPFPVLRIWEVNQEDATESSIVRLDAGGCDILVRRQGADVVFAVLHPAEMRLLAALAAGASLEQAVTEALALDCGFDVGASLHKHVGFGTFAECLSQPH